MKKLILIIVSIALLVSLMGCKPVVPQEETSMLRDEGLDLKKILTIADYFPFKENIIMKYEGIGNEYAEQTTFIEFVENNRAQMKIMNPGTVFVKVLEYSNGELKEVFTEGEFYHIENMINTNSNTNNTILKEPIEIGNQWVNGQGNLMEITSLDKEISTPLGTYQALEVTTEYEEGKNLKEYYAKDIGLVAKVYDYTDMEVKTLLEEIKIENEEIQIMAFYPRKDTIETSYVMQNIEFETNEDIKSILEDILKNPPEEYLLPVISQATKINKLNLNRDTWTLEVDFSEDLTRDMNLGSSLEIEIIKSIVNTLGKYYDVEKVYISLDDKPYESGHLGLKTGEYFLVDINDIEE